MAISTVSSNFAFARSLTSFTASSMRIKLDPVDALARLDDAFSNMRHRAHPTTSRPIERAEPSIIGIAASTVAQLRSGSFFSAISLICALVILPTKPRPVVFDPT